MHVVIYFKDAYTLETVCSYVHKMTEEQCFSRIANISTGYIFRGRVQASTSPVAILYSMIYSMYVLVHGEQIHITLSEAMLRSTTSCLGYC